MLIKENHYSKFKSILSKEEIVYETDYPFYYCSESGLVISCNPHCHLEPKLLKWCFGSNGYAKVYVAHRQQAVHRLVAETFYGRSDSFVLHNDGNCKNNHISNLRYGTQKENMADKTKHKTTAKGERHGMTKFKYDHAKEAKELIFNSDLNCKEIADLLNNKYNTNYTRYSVSDIKRNRTWKHIIL